MSAAKSWIETSAECEQCLYGCDAAGHENCGCTTCDKCNNADSHGRCHCLETGLVGIPCPYFMPYEEPMEVIDESEEVSKCKPTI